MRRFLTGSFLHPLRGHESLGGTRGGLEPTLFNFKIRVAACGQVLMDALAAADLIVLTTYGSVIIMASCGTIHVGLYICLM